MKKIIFKITLLAFLPVIIHSAAITDSNEMLLNGVYTGELKLVEDALRNGAEINCIDHNDFYNKTPFLWAANNGHYEIVEILIKAKANIDSTDTCQYTALHYAAINGRTSIVNLLIYAKAAINFGADYQLTPLHYAATNGQTEVVDALIRAGATIDSKDTNQRTPLQDAVMQGHSTTIYALMNAGADLTLISKKNSCDLIKSNMLISQIKKDDVIKTISEFLEEHQMAMSHLPEFIHEQILLPLPLAKIIAEYAHNIKFQKQEVKRCVIQ